MDIKEIQDQQKTLLASAEEQRDEIYSSMDYLDIDDMPETDWRNGRDAAYIEELISCRQLLVEALEMLSSADEKSIHRGRKTLEQAIAAARSVRHERHEDIRKAQEVIDVMNEMLNICNDVRKQ